MVNNIYKKALSVLAQKPFKLWGIALLSILLSVLCYALFGLILGVAIALEIAVIVGTLFMFLRGYQGEEVRAIDLFEVFRDWQTFKRVVLGVAWMYLWIFVWSLIPVVGIVFAIIRTYEYRLTPYLLITDKDLPITEAIKVSKEKTNGYKARMFWADVFAPLVFLGVCVVLGALSFIPYVGIGFMVLLGLVALVYAFISPLFMGLVGAGVYLAIESGEFVNEKTEKPKKEKDYWVCVHCHAVNKKHETFCRSCGYYR